MQTIKILGTGCAKCQQTVNIVNQAIEKYSLDATVEKVEDIMKIMEYNVMSTPAVVLNEEVKIKGRVPTVEEIKALF
ncbi:MAG: thioredoxin family protein [Luteibaculaceae bacterium]